MPEVIDVKDLINQRYEPFRKNRWLLAIEGIDSFLLAKAAQPTITTEEVELPYINTRRYLAGLTKFGTMSITLHESIAPSATQQVMEWHRLAYEAVSGRGGYADFYKRDCQIKMLDPVGTVASAWDIRGAFPTEMNFGELDYADGGILDLEMVLRYDLAILQY